MKTLLHGEPRPRRRRGGRPRIAESERRSSAITVRFTSDERRVLDETARGLGLHTADLLRDVLAQRQLPMPPTPVLDHRAFVLLNRLTEFVRMAVTGLSYHHQRLRELQEKVRITGRYDRLLSRIETTANAAELALTRVNDAEQACWRLGVEVQQGRSGLPPDAASKVDTRLSVIVEAGKNMESRLRALELLLAAVPEPEA